jgi:hypothetical protein
MILANWRRSIKCWEQGVADTNKQNLVRLDDVDLDRPIYRIYDLDRFKALLASKVDALVNPTEWCERRSNNPSLKLPDFPVAPE